MKKLTLFVFLIATGLLLIAQNTPPVAVNDTIDGGICGDTLYLDVMENDYHSEGKEISIKSVRASLNNFVKLEITGDLIRYTHPYVPVNMEMDTIYYTIMLTDDPESVSDEAKVFINLQLHPDLPQPKPDDAAVFAGWHSVIDVLANDDMKDFEPEHLFLTLDRHLGVASTFEMVVDYTPFMASSGKVKGRYLMTDLESFAAASAITIDITGNKSYDSLTVNNINAGIHSDGYLFCNYNEIPEISLNDYRPHFEYPEGSGKHTIFSTALWIGGLDENDSLHLAAQRYKQVGYDYQFGPVSDDYSSEEYFRKWSRLWNVSKTEVSYHRNNYWKDDYQPVEAIANWPGNGDIELGQAAMLAPFVDKDADGVYEPMSGDYPLIRGDQTIFFIYNDDRYHGETQGAPLKVEIHGMAYAFSEPTDHSLFNTVFLHLDLYNRSSNTYSETYLGYFTDFDIGYAWDDYVGSHVQWGSSYGYNGVETDGNGEPGTYGDKPPAQSSTVLAGPFLDADNNDNPTGQCDYGLNGLNFGDGIIDNERMGMTRVVNYGNGATPWGDPQISPEYYTYMLGLWRDKTPILYGGNGIPPIAEGPECRFMYPGDSDTCNWGTAGVLPNGGYNQNGKYWTEGEVENIPSDRRGLGVSGPFTFKPGDVQEVELAYSVGQGEDAEGSVEQLFEILEDLFTRVRKGELIVPNEILDVGETIRQSTNLKVYPNPADDKIYVMLPDELQNKGLSYHIFNSMGLKLTSGNIAVGNDFSISVENLKYGLYFIIVYDTGEKYFGKFVKM